MTEASASIWETILNPFQVLRLPVESFQAKHPDVSLETTPESSPEVDLDQLIEIFVETDERQIRIVEEGKCVGVVTRGALLRGIQGKEVHA